MTRNILENPTKERHLLLTKDTIEALEELNQSVIDQAAQEGREVQPGELVDIPDKVVLLLREATMREKYRFERDQKAATDYHTWLTGILMRRAAPGTDERVVRELIVDMTESTVATLIHAYQTGEMPDPKLLGQVVSQTLSGMAGSLLTNLSNALGRS